MEYAFAIRLTLDDWRAYRKACSERARPISLHRWAVMVVVMAGAAAGTALAFDVAGIPLRLTSVLSGSMLGLLGVLLYVRSWSAACQPDDGSLHYDDVHYLLDALGVHVTRPEIESRTRWPAVRDVTRSAEHLYLWIDRMQAHVIPWRELPADVSPSDLLASVDAWRRESPTTVVQADALPEPAGALLTRPGAGDPGRRSWLSGLPRVLALRAAPGLEEAPAWLVWLLAIFASTAWAGVDRLRTGPGALFHTYGAQGIAWYALMLIAAAAALSWYSKPRVSLRSALAILLALVLVLLALAAVTIRAPVPEPVVIAGAVLVGLYCIAVAARMLNGVSGRNQPRAVLNAAIVSVVAWLATALVYVTPGLWYAPEAEADSAYDAYRDRAEALLFEQPLRIQTAMADIVPSEGDGPAAFFLGFAGFGEERVFAEEIKFAASVLAKRYGTAGRSILLLNDRRNLDAQPFATVSSLRYALQALAQKMDVDEDVLFLSLSSHGSKDYLSVSHGPLMLRNLTDAALADALEESGIKWRVIVISACHSGSFIDELKNPNTIVITAAAADRTSFGCSDDRELTYFGEEFYREALPEADSLRDAFEKAVEAIAERERREDIEPSRPQAHFGEAIETRLGQLERSAAHRRSTAAVVR